MNEVVLMEATSGLAGGFQTIATNVSAGIAEVAPIALTVMGVILVWRIGTKFFKSVAK